jgi:hypothetical protein
MVDERWERERNIILTPGEERQVPPLRVNPEGRSVRGWVGDEQQEAMAGAIVTASSIREYRLPDEYQEPTYTNERGYFELTGLPMRRWVTIVAAHPTKPLFATEEIDPDWGFEPGLVLGAVGHVAGRLLDAAGQPLAGARVSVSPPVGYYGYGAASELRLRLQAAGFLENNYTDENGRWSTDGLIPGVEYSARAAAPGDDSGSASAEFTARSGETIDLGDMVLQERERRGGAGVAGGL